MIVLPIIVIAIVISDQEAPLLGRNGWMHMGEELKLHLMLKRLMAEKGVHLGEVVKACQVPQATLSGYLAGTSPSNPAHILSLSRYFGVSMEMLLFGADHREPTLEELLTEPVFEGWLKVKIERAIPGKRKSRSEEEDQ